MISCQVFAVIFLFLIVGGGKSRESLIMHDLILDSVLLTTKPVKLTPSPETNILKLC